MSQTQPFDPPGSNALKEQDLGYWPAIHYMYVYTQHTHTIFFPVIDKVSLATGVPEKMRNYKLFFSLNTAPLPSLGN